MILRLFFCWDRKCKKHTTHATKLKNWKNYSNSAWYIGIFFQKMNWEKLIPLITHLTAERVTIPLQQYDSQTAPYKRFKQGYLCISVKSAAVVLSASFLLISSLLRYCVSYQRYVAEVVWFHKFLFQKLCSSSVTGVICFLQLFFWKHYSSHSWITPVSLAK